MARSVGATGLAAGVDLAPAMAARARQRLATARPAGRAEVRIADARSLPYDAAQFDAAFLSFTLELFSPDDAATVLAECRRVLTPGGRIVVVALSKDGPGNLARSIYACAHALAPNLIDCQPIHAQRALANAGFRIEVAQRRRMAGLPVEVILARATPDAGPGNPAFRVLSGSTEFPRSTNTRRRTRSPQPSNTHNCACGSGCPGGLAEPRHKRASAQAAHRICCPS